MDENRKKIIVKEILYWKESRLLPAQYCDYLLALYTEGEQPQENKQERQKQVAPRLPYLILLLIPIVIAFLYFTELSFDLQMALLIILLIGTVILTGYFFRKGLSYHIPLVIGAFILLLISVDLTVTLFPGQNTLLYAVLLFNCFIWVLAGKKLNLIYFRISAYLGMLTIFVSFFF